jgi:hypothetical protein
MSNNTASQLESDDFIEESNLEVGSASLLAINRTARSSDPCLNRDGRFLEVSISMTASSDLGKPSASA